MRITVTFFDVESNPLEAQGFVPLCCERQTAIAGMVEIHWFRVDDEAYIITRHLDTACYTNSYGDWLVNGCAAFDLEHGEFKYASWQVKSLAKELVGTSAEHRELTL